MARRVSGPIPGSVRDFIPEAFGNRDEADPITVVLSTPTERQKREWHSVIARSFRRDESGQVIRGDDGSAMIDPLAGDGWHRAVLTVAVVEVRNYVGASSSEITTGEDLHEHGEGEIVYEVSAAAMAGASMDDDQKKASDAQSGSDSKAQAPLSGTASDARRAG